MKVIARINTSFYSGSEIILAVGKKNTVIHHLLFEDQYQVVPHMSCL